MRREGGLFLGARNSFRLQGLRQMVGIALDLVIT